MDSRYIAPENGPTAGTPSRRTRRTAAAVATTVGAAAVVGTAFAAPADAASEYHVWDRVAHCESTGNWHIDSGNGFYGGLQFSSGTWQAYGGHRYARQADNASRMEQIQVARRVLKEQGPDAWPVCGPNAGLTKSNGHATAAPLPHDATGPTHARKTKHERHESHSAHKRHHKAKHAASKSHAKSHHKTYRVRSGDTLSTIARAHHVHGGWHALFRANRSHMSSPNVLRVGQVLTLP